MTVINKIEKVITIVLLSLMGLILTFMVGSNVAQIITRYFVDVILLWVEDLSVIGLYWLVGLGAPLLWLQHGHLVMDVVSGFIPARVLHWVDAGIHCFAIAAGIGLTYVAKLAIEINRGYVMSLVGYDESFRYIPLVVFGVGLSVAGVLKLIETIAIIRGKKEAISA